MALNERLFSLNRTDFISNVCEYLCANNKRKTVPIPRQVFTISTDSGQSHQFSVKPSNKDFRYTREDVDAFLEAFVYVIKESLKNGEEVSLQNFGTFGVKYRKPRWVYHPETGEKIDVDGMYLPKFKFSSDLRRCAGVYGERKKDAELEEKVAEMPSGEYLDEYFCGDGDE